MYILIYMDKVEKTWNFGLSCSFICTSHVKLGKYVMRLPFYLSVKWEWYAFCMWIGQVLIPEFFSLNTYCSTRSVVGLNSGMQDHAVRRTNYKELHVDFWLWGRWMPLSSKYSKLTIVSGWQGLVSLYLVNYRAEFWVTDVSPYFHIRTILKVLTSCRILHFNF